MDIVDDLMKTGLTRQEANIYLLLLTEGELTGYEVSKISGISRSNTYTALAALVDKGAARCVEGKATKYVPVGFDEYGANKLRELQKTIDSVKAGIPAQREAAEAYITISGDNNIENKIKNMIAEAEERIYISAGGDILRSAAPDLAAAVRRGLKVVIITAPPFESEGAVVYFDKKQPPDQIRLIADSHNVLTGEIVDGGGSTCLFSRKKNLADVIKESIKNEIKLIELGAAN